MLSEQFQDPIENRRKRQISFLGTSANQIKEIFIVI